MKINIDRDMLLTELYDLRSVLAEAALISDEAHHINVQTKRKSKIVGDIEAVQLELGGDNWEASVEKIFICAFNFEQEITSCLSEELGWRGEVILPLPSKIRRYKVLG